MIVFFFTILFSSCTSTDEKIYSYIENHCVFETEEICYMDIRDALKVDFDTMYIFPGYPVPKEVVSYVLRTNYEKAKENSDADLIILVKDKKIVYESEWTHSQVAIDGGKEYFEVTSEDVIFDGEKLPFSYLVYVTSIFKVEKVSNPSGQLNKSFYIITNVVNQRPRFKS